ncbi:MAG TPA: hypothetical protein VLW26_04425 [Steroidobacteraceae bacterium]|nr:hypothetical protein [Steroidobacteraceae bacterium]
MPRGPGSVLSTPKTLNSPDNCHLLDELATGMHIFMALSQASPEEQA